MNISSYLSIHILHCCKQKYTVEEKLVRAGNTINIYHLHVNTPQNKKYTKTTTNNIIPEITLHHCNATILTNPKGHNNIPDQFVLVSTACLFLNE